jgi:uncharacterized peroxidase-related enzyme
MRAFVIDVCEMIIDFEFQFPVIVNRIQYDIRAHAHDLRAGVTSDWGWTNEDEADQLVHLIASDWRQAPLGSADLALCVYAEKLTLTPTEMSEEDLERLRQHGFDDRGIHDATLVIAYFNYINRIADSLGVEQEEFIRPWEQ